MSHCVILLFFLLLTLVLVQSQLQCDILGICEGEVEGQAVTDTIQDCHDFCRQNQDCKWFSYDSSNHQCLQFETCPSINDECSTCTTSQVECEEENSQRMTKLMIVSGDPQETGVVTEILDLSGSGLTCDNLPEFPVQLAGAVGGLLNGKIPFICGGYEAVEHLTTKCHIYSPGQGFQPATDTETLITRWYASAVVVKEDTLFITGGTDILNSTEYVSPGKESRFGPAIPADMLGHCMTKINDTTIAVIGDYTLFFFNMETEEWTPGPFLTRPRLYGSCGVLSKDTGSGPKVLVAAGTFYDNVLVDNSVEFLDLDQPEEWVSGPDLPEGRHSGQMVSLPDVSGLVYLGGYNELSDEYFSNILELKCSGPENDSCSWTERTEKLQEGREDFVAMYVPDDLVQCS